MSITVIGAGQSTQCTALLLLLRDDCRVALTHDSAADALDAAHRLGAHPRAVGQGWAALSGADVVVVLALDEQAPEELARRCPAAVVLVVTDDPAIDCAAVQAVLNAPRTQVLGRGMCGPCGPLRTAADAAALAGHVLGDHDAEVEATVLCRGEHGHEGWATVPVRLGARGVSSFA